MWWQLVNGFILSLFLESLSASEKPCKLENEKSIENPNYFVKIFESDPLIISLCEAVKRGELSALDDKFFKLSAPSNAHLMAQHWSAITRLLTDRNLEVVECINELKWAASWEEYCMKSQALEVRECIFEYISFAVENEKCFDANKSTIFELLKIIIEQHRLPDMFRLLFKFAALRLSHQEIIILIDYLISESTELEPGSPLPINFELFAVVVKYAPEAFETWLLNLYNSEIEKQWVFYLPVYFVFSTRNISETLKEYLSEQSFDLNTESMKILDAFIVASGITELYNFAASSQHKEAERLMELFLFILGRFSESAKNQQINLELYVAKNRLYAVMEALLRFDPFSYYNTNVIKEIFFYSVHLPSTKIEWTPLMLLKTYREIDLEILNYKQQSNISFMTAFKLRDISLLFKAIDCTACSFAFGSRLRGDSDAEFKEPSNPENSETIILSWNEPKAFHDLIVSKVSDTTISRFTSFLIQYILAQYFFIPFSAAKFKSSELIFMWRTILEHINFFIHMFASKYNCPLYVIQ